MLARFSPILEKASFFPPSNIFSPGVGQRSACIPSSERCQRATKQLLHTFISVLPTEPGWEPTYLEAQKQLLSFLALEKEPNKQINYKPRFLFFFFYSREVLQQGNLVSPAHLEAAFYCRTFQEELFGFHPFK